MKKVLLGSTALFAMILMAMSLLQTSCAKETDCSAVVTVLDTVATPIVGATVRLDYQGGGLQSDQQTTDASGRASFTFKYEAVLDITVTHPQHPTTTGIIKLEAGRTVNETITMP